MQTLCFFSYLTFALIHSDWLIADRCSSFCDCKISVVIVSSEFTKLILDAHMLWFRFCMKIRIYIGK